MRHVACCVYRRGVHFPTHMAVTKDIYIGHLGWGPLVSSLGASDPGLAGAGLGMAGADSKAITISIAAVTRKPIRWDLRKEKVAVGAC